MIANINGNSMNTLILMVCIAITLISIAFAISLALVWDKEPWWRNSPKPSRQYRNAKEQVKIYRIMRKHPEAFDNFHPEIMKEREE